MFYQIFTYFFTRAKKVSCLVEPTNSLQLKTSEVISSCIQAFNWILQKKVKSGTEF